MRKILLFFCIHLSIVCSAQVDSIVQRLFLIGDAGVLNGNSHPVLDWLSKNVDWNDDKNVALFIGDNIYPDGLPDEGDLEYAYTKKVIDYQLNLVKGKKSRAFFVPGNHDWKGGKIGGWERVTNQVNYINSLGAANIKAFPLNGCPGPVPVELNEKVVLVMMDSQWFLHIHDKPGPVSACEARSIEEFTAELRQIIESHPNQLVVLMMHHPMYTFGVHGGAFGLKQHLFPFADAIKGLYIPLPVLGSVYPLARGLFGSLQDTYHPLYRTMIREIEEVLKDHPNPITVAGHEHSLQLIIKDSIPHIVSGSAAKLTRLRKGPNLLFSILDYGFSMLEVRKSGKVEVKFYNLQSNGLGGPIFIKELKTIVPVTPPATMDTLFPVMGKVQVQGSSGLTSGPIRNLLWGENYRNEWTEKISVPMLDLGTEMGGLKPVRQIGANQTKSLALAEKNGKEWILRSIEKFPVAVSPADLRSDLQNKTLSKGVSGAYPYASLSVPVLENAVGVPTLRRKLVYVPDDPRLERFRTGFKNSLAILEEREPAGVGKTYSSEELVLLLAKSNNDHVDQKAVLRARLIDNFVMDFDRHEGQYRWATRDTGRGKLYFPIPRDHDQAFFKSEGIIARFLTVRWFMPQLQGFDSKARSIKTFNKTAADFDRFFLNGLSEDDWVKEIDSLLMRLTDEVINTAMNQQPQEIRKFNAEEIAKTLKERKLFFKDEMIRYYRFISKRVNIVGTNEREIFAVTKKDNGSVQVIAQRIDPGGTISSGIYKRVFESNVTKEIRIYALEGNDSIVVSGSNTPIIVRIVGGPGNDHYVNLAGSNSARIYDAGFEQNVISGNTSGFDKHLLPDPEVNRYNRLSYRYNYVDPSFPVEYNKDDGLRIGFQMEYVKQGFRKEPYARRQSLKIDRAFGINSYRFRYEGDYMKIIKQYDVLVRADVKAPNYVSNFFGLGNNTIFDKTKGIQHYRAYYNMGSISILPGKQLQSWMRIGLGPSFQYIKTPQEKNSGKFVSGYSANGMNTATMFQTKTYAGLEGRIDINSRNNPAIPTRGALINVYARQLFGLNANSKSFLQSGLDLRIFMSFVPQTKVVFATRVGFGRNFGRYEFQQAQTLSGIENLRGFRRERFAGRTMVYNNSELRVKVVDFPTYIFSGTVGVLVFHDIGRVGLENDSSDKWHNGYGGGIWLAPIKRFVIVGSLAFSKEEKAMPLLTFGFQF
jgi:hypothetical protein